MKKKKKQSFRKFIINLLRTSTWYFSHSSMSFMKILTLEIIILNFKNPNQSNNSLSTYHLRILNSKFRLNSVVRIEFNYIVYLNTVLYILFFSCSI